MKKFKLYSIYLLILLFVAILLMAFINLKKNIDNKSDQLSYVKKNLDNKKAQLKNIHNKLLKKNINIENLVFEDGITFKSKINKNLKLKEYNYNFKEFASDDMIFAKHPDASSSAYIDYYDDNIFLVTATGQITYSNVKNLDDDKFILSSIKSNIQEVIRYEEFYYSSQFGIKDILVHNNQIYVSYIKEHSKDCFSTSILKGEVNFSYIFFNEFYSPDKCIEKDNKFYDTHKKDKMTAHQAGGRMIIINNDLVFSTGEFRYRILAQDPDSDFGKIISINLFNKSKKIISMGHRNPQGLYFDKDLNTLFSTEHGPSGGDEINSLDFNQTNANDIPNYGWPISSYGRHYFDLGDDDDSRYKLSPLKKSHSKYGFIEPLKYFDPSIAISQIIGIPDAFYKSDNNSFLVGTMGNAKKLKKGMLSILFFEYDDDNKIISSEFIPLLSRVRDMIFVEDMNSVLMYLETNNSLAILKKK
jgi:hypothetical protein